MPDVPPIFNVALAACVRPPDPERAVATVNVLLLVKVTPVTVILGMENVPLSCWELLSKVCTPVPAVNVPLLVIPPLNVTFELPLLFQVPPAFTVTNPVNIFVPAVALMVKLPLVPPPMVVVPETVRLKPAALKV